MLACLFCGVPGSPLYLFHLNKHPCALPPFLLTVFWNKKLPSMEPGFVSPAFLHSYNPRCTSTIPQRFSGVSTNSQFLHSRPETGESSLEHVLILQKSPQMCFKYLCWIGWLPIATKFSSVELRPLASSGSQKAPTLTFTYSHTYTQFKRYATKLGTKRLESQPHAPKAVFSQSLPLPPPPFFLLPPLLCF